MEIIQGEVDLLNDKFKLIENIFSTSFPWYYQNAYDGINQFNHTLMTRETNESSEWGTTNSFAYEPCQKAFLSFCHENNIVVNKIFRAAINRTFYHSEKNVGIHHDHNFEHKVFLLYLNTVDGDTVLFDNNKKEVFRSKPEKGKVIVFPGGYHTHEFCKPGELRTVLVFTFK